MKEVFTIGHSNHTLENFLELLTEYKISAIGDVRSNPYSQYLPHFNKELLENALRNVNVDYVFLGSELGARRSENSCYIDGQAKYDRIAQLPAFRHGIERVLEGIERYIIALMCSESCHTLRSSRGSDSGIFAFISFRHVWSIWRSSAAFSGIVSARSFFSPKSSFRLYNSILLSSYHSMSL